MTITTVVETVVDPVVMLDGDRVYATQRTITTTHDIRETAFGPVDFGTVHWGPPVPALGETFTFDVDAKPPWWAFWRKPTKERREFVVTGAHPFDV